MHETQEYYQGHRVGFMGGALSANPYLPGSEESAAWQTGCEWGQFKKATEAAIRAEEIYCPYCETVVQRILLKDGTWRWEPDSDISSYHEPDVPDNDAPLSVEHKPVASSDDDWDEPRKETFACKLCNMVFGWDSRPRYYSGSDEEIWPAFEGNGANKDFGFVYVVRSSGRIRIGKATSETRYRSYQTSLPNGAEILKVWYVERPLCAEDWLHRKYARYQVHGSWYDFPANVLAELLNTSSFPAPAVFVRVHETQSTF